MANGNDWWRDWWSRWLQPGPAGYGAWEGGPPAYAGRGTPAWGTAGMPQYVRRGTSLPQSGLAGGRGMPFAGWGEPTAGQYTPSQGFGMLPPPQGIQPIPGQYTPSQGFGMLPPPTRATPGMIPGGRTPVEQALADVAATAVEPQGEPGPWGGEMGRYPVPWSAIEGMPSWRREWEEWSWSERGIPLQGYEIWRLSRNVPPWGRAPYAE